MGENLNYISCIIQIHIVLSSFRLVDSIWMRGIASSWMGGGWDSQWKHQTQYHIYFYRNVKYNLLNFPGKMITSSLASWRRVEQEKPSNLSPYTIHMCIFWFRQIHEHNNNVWIKFNDVLIYRNAGGGIIILWCNPDVFVLKSFLLRV